MRKISNWEEERRPRGLGSVWKISTKFHKPIWVCPNPFGHEKITQYLPIPNSFLACIPSQATHSSLDNPLYKLTNYTPQPF